MSRNPADRPATEPRTYIMGIDPDEDAYLVRQEQERIEAEAAQGAAPRAEGPTRTQAYERTRQFYNERNLPQVYYDYLDAAVRSIWTAALAAPRAEGLDVERLAAAIQVVRDYDDDYDAADEAQQIAAEYLASRPSDERVPESET